MADSNVLREFLVSLGWTVDEEQHKKFQRGLKMSTEEVGKLGFAIGSVSVALIEGMKRIADQFADLGYLAQRLSTSTENLQDLALGFKQVGGSMADVVSQGNVMRQLLQNPIQKAVLAQWLGVDPKSITDAKVGIDDLVKHFSAAFKHGGIERTLAENQLRALGFSPDALTPAMMNPEAFFKAEQDQASIYKHLGLDTDDLAKKSMELKRQWGLLGAEIEGAGDKLTSLFIDPAIKGLTLVNTEITELEKLFGKFDPATQKWVGAGAAIATVSGGLATAVVSARALMSILGLRGAAGAAAAGAGAGAEAAGAAGGAAAGAGARAASGLFSGSWLTAILPFWAGLELGNLATSGPGSKEWANQVNKQHGDFWKGILGLFKTPATGPIHHESYRVLGGEGGGLLHQASFTPGGGDDVDGDLRDWLRGNRTFIPAVRIVDDKNGAGGGFGFNGVIPASYDPGGGNNRDTHRSTGDRDNQNNHQATGGDDNQDIHRAIANWRKWANPSPSSLRDTLGFPPVPPALKQGIPAGEIRPGWSAQNWKEMGRGWDQAAALIEKFESGGRNIMNYINDAKHTAGGLFQITDSTWKQFSGMVEGASQYHSAINAPAALQKEVARLIWEQRGFGPWANYDNPLAAALRSIDQTALGSDVHHHHHHEDQSKSVVGHQGDLNVTIHAPGAGAAQLADAVTRRHSRALGDAIRLISPSVW